MHVLFISQMGTEILKAICWTLVHSLWQSLLLVIASGLVVLFTKKRHPSIRYNILSGLFLLFILITVYTFTSQLRHAGLNNVALLVSIQEALNQTEQDVPALNEYNFRSVANSFSNDFIYYFDTHAPLIVVVWFIILTARLLKMVSGLTYIHKVRTQKVHHPKPYWESRFLELQKLLRIKKNISLMESGIIKVPMAIGWLKPIILVPIGLFNRLPEAELEAILLHELAHIKRKDYFVNLVQSFAETIFFFNPAVLWVSSLIREERENCCDDVAISHTKSKTRFINALVSFQDYNVAEFAMPFPGRKNQLLNRVQRIIYNTNNTLNSIERAGIISCCVVIMLLSAFIIPQHGKHLIISQIQKIENKITGVTSGLSIREGVAAARNIEEKPHTPSKELSKNNVTKDYTRPSKSSTMKPHKSSGYSRTEEQPADTTPIKKVTHLYNINVNPKVNLSLNNVMTLNPLVSLTKIVVSNKVNVRLENLNFQMPKPSYHINYDSLRINIDSSFYRHSYEPDSSHKIKNYRPVQRVNPLPQANAIVDPVIVNLIKAKVVDEDLIKNYQDFADSLNSKELVVQGIKQAEYLYEKLKNKNINLTGNRIRYYICLN